MTITLTLTPDELAAAEGALGFLSRLRKTANDDVPIVYLAPAFGIAIYNIRAAVTAQLQAVQSQRDALLARFGVRNSQGLYVYAMRPLPGATSTDAACDHPPQTLTCVSPDRPQGQWSCGCGMRFVPALDAHGGVGIHTTDAAEFHRLDAELSAVGCTLAVQPLTMEQLLSLPSVPVEVVGVLQRFVAPPC